MRTVLMWVFLPCSSAHHVKKRNICWVISAVWLCSLFWAGAPLLGWGSYRGRIEVRHSPSLEIKHWVELEITELNFLCSSRVWDVWNRLGASTVLCSGQTLRHQHFLLQLLCATICYNLYVYIHHPNCQLQPQVQSWRRYQQEAEKDWMQHHTGKSATPKMTISLLKG